MKKKKLSNTEAELKKKNAAHKKVNIFPNTVHWGISTIPKHLSDSTYMKKR